MNVHSAILRICGGIIASRIGRRTVSESHIRSSFHDIRLAKPNTVYAFFSLFAILPTAANEFFAAYISTY
ncbi:hypothetical protein SDC9_85228 [bioreactor metagenome]|uniref:Uncharacterized protein n=1 Tax=bioreactor metagenome TaxID=1076179 RepID=A0A644ZCX3_9ZZZZ